MAHIKYSDTHLNAVDGQVKNYSFHVSNKGISNGTAGAGGVNLKHADSNNTNDTTAASPDANVGGDLSARASIGTNYGGGEMDSDKSELNGNRGGNQNQSIGRYVT